jgi:uncharacterized protein Veg
MYGMIILRGLMNLGYGMTSEEAKADMMAQIKRAADAFKAKAVTVSSNKVKAVTRACYLIENYSKRLITNTTTAKEYLNTATFRMVKYNQPRSLPLYAPAVDRGMMRRSITHDVSEHFGVAIGRVGSTINNPPYPLYLENGTKYMTPRPWLLPSVDANQAEIKALFKKVFSSTDGIVAIIEGS